MTFAICDKDSPEVTGRLAAPRAVTAPPSAGKRIGRLAIKSDSRARHVEAGKEVTIATHD